MNKCYFKSVYCCSKPQTFRDQFINYQCTTESAQVLSPRTEKKECNEPNSEVNKEVCINRDNNKM